LRRLDPERYDLALLLLARDGEYLAEVPEHVALLDLGGIRARSALVPLSRLIRRRRPDIVFSTHAYMNILCLITSFFVGSGTVFFARHPVMPHATTGFHKLLLRLLYPRAGRIIAQTHALREAMAKIFHLSRDRIEVLVNPVDTALIDSRVEGQANPFDPATLNFVAAGRLTYQKGFDVLLEAFRVVLEQEPAARLHILGEGEDRPNLESTIREYGLSQVVTLPGFQRNPYPYFKFADLFVLSSRYEGLPNTVLESLYLGTACVATRCIPFLTDIIQEPDNGALVDVEDAGALAEKLLNRGAYRLAPERLNVEGSLSVETLFE